MKRLLALTLALLLVLSLCACNSSNTNAPTVDDPKHTDPTPTDPKPTQPAAPTDPKPTQPAAPTDPKPTNAEKAVLEKYRDLFDFLYTYGRNGSAEIKDKEAGYLSGQEALGYVYERLNALDTSVIDKWVGTEYTSSVYVRSYQTDTGEVDWDYKSLLAGYKKESVVQSQVITTVDQLGNQESETVMMEYRTDGSIIEKYSAFYLIAPDPSGHLSYDKEYVYDDAGQVIQINYMYDNKVVEITTPTYNDKGVIIREHIKTRSYERDICYEYDTQGRLTSITSQFTPGEGESIFGFTFYYYTYDAKGNVLKEEKVWYNFRNDFSAGVIAQKEIKEYTYDENGHLIAGTYTGEVWNHKGKKNSATGKYDIEWNRAYTEKRHQYTFTTNSEGLIEKLVITPGDTVYVSGDKAGQVQSVAGPVKTYEFVYGDYYVYTPVN